MIRRFWSAARGIPDELFKPVDVASLAVFRVVFGLSCLWMLLTRYDYDFVYRMCRPGFHVPYLGFEWVQPLPGNGPFIEVYALRVLALCMTLGLLYRPATLLFFVGYTHLFLVDQTFYQNHFYLICLLGFLLLFMPAHRAYSVDALLRPRLRSRTIPAWPVWTLRLQLAIPFFFGGLTKLNYDWLHGEPLRSFLDAKASTTGPPSEWLVYGMSYGGLVFDLVIPFMFFSRRLRLLAYNVSLAFHTMNDRLWDIDVFPFLLIGGTLIYFDPDWPRQVWNRIRKSTRASESTTSPTVDHTRASKRALALLLAGYFVVQVFVPLRHLVYPGDVLWTDEGRYFAWRMFGVRKRGLATFVARDSTTGETWTVDPTEFGLPAYGASTPWTNPHNARWFARRAAEEYENEGRPGIEIRAEVHCSLHRRPPALMLDPEVNLADVPMFPSYGSWVHALEEPLPSTDAERRAALDSWVGHGGNEADW